MSHTGIVADHPVLELAMAGDILQQWVSVP